MVFDIAEFLKQDFASSIIILTLILITIVIIEIFRKRIYSFFKKKTNVSKLKLMKLEFPVIMLLVVLGAQIIIDKLLSQFSLDATIGRTTTTILIILLTYTLMIIASFIIEAWSSHLHRVRRDDTHEEIVPLTKSITNIILSLIALVFILQTWNVAVGALLASLGVAGIVLGFAFKDTLTNIFGGLLLMIDDSFRKGDLVELPDGEIGYIEETNLRSTKLKNFDNEEVLIPNGTLVNMKIKNYAHPSKSIRIRIHVSIAYGSNIDKAESVIMDVITKKKESLRYPKPTILFEEMADYSLNLKVMFYIKDYHELFQVKSDTTKEIYNALRKNNIPIPFPTRTLYFGDDAKNVISKRVKKSKKRK